MPDQAKVTKALMPLSFGASLRLGVPAGLISSIRVPPVGAAEGCDLLILLLPLLWLLILIYPPLREAERRCSSGDWRAALFDAVEHIACRS